MIKSAFTHVLLGMLMLILAFFAGSHRQLWVAFAGFLSFFVIGITLIIEGFKRRKIAK